MGLSALLVLAGSLASFAQTRVGGEASGAGTGQVPGSAAPRAQEGGPASGYTGPAFVVEFVVKDGLAPERAHQLLLEHEEWLARGAASGWLLMAGQLPFERGSPGLVPASQTGAQPQGPANQMGVFAFGSASELLRMLRANPAVEGGLFATRHRSFVISLNAPGVLGPGGARAGGTSAGGPARR
jgi:uncharacterized protein YciI